MVGAHSTTTTHYSIKAKKLWSFLRIAFIMIRKGLMSKRKLIMNMNLLVMKRGKLLRKNLGNYLMFHHSKTPAASAGSFGIGHYEFSCTNTPINPSAAPFFHHAAAKRKHHYYFPCINPPPPTDELEEEFEQVQQPPAPTMVLVLPITASKINYPSSYSTATDHFTPEEKKMNSVMVSSPLSAVSSYYSSEGEEAEYENESDQEDEEQVDAAAEDFIRRFYEQLRMQNGTHRIHYQEIQYQEMLAGQGNLLNKSGVSATA